MRLTLVHDGVCLQLKQAATPGVEPPEATHQHGRYGRDDDEAQNWRAASCWVRQGHCPSHTFTATCNHTAEHSR